MLPNAYLDQIKNILGAEFDAFVESYKDNPVKSLRINTLKGSILRFLEINPFDISVNDAVSWCESGFYLKDEMTGAGKHPLHSAGVYYIQEASAMSPVQKLDVKPGMKVLDLCASPGGKSTQISSFLNNQGILVSNEPDRDRARILSENVERMGISNALVISHYPDEISDRFCKYFDRILVDAPCSGEGMFRKNPEAIKEWSLDNVKMCAERQREILSSAYRMLREGGRLVYSTCTFSLEENEDNAKWFADQYGDIILVESGRIWPHKAKGEGHFYAVFEKRSSADTKEVGLIGVSDYTDDDSHLKHKPKKQKHQDVTLDFSTYYEFEAQVLKQKISETVGPDDGSLFKYGDELYYLPKDFPKMQGLRVIRSGLHLGTLKKNRFEPSHALALFLKPDMVYSSVSLNTEDAFRYLRGETLPANIERGWVLIDYEGYGLGWGKASPGIIKNHYPKGLRLL